MRLAEHVTDGPVSQLSFNYQNNTLLLASGDKVRAFEKNAWTDRMFPPFTLLNPYLCYCR